MEQPPGQNNGGDHQGESKNAPIPPVAKELNKEAEPNHNDDRARKRPVRKKSIAEQWRGASFVGRVQASSAAIQALCAVIIAALTLCLWLTTCSYTNYTSKQAAAEATSAAQETKAVKAEATQFATANSQFNKQLSKIQDSINAANQQAVAASRQADASTQQANANVIQAQAAKLTASTSQRTLADNESVQAADVAFTDMSVNYGNDQMFIQTFVKNFGATVARQVDVASDFVIYRPGLPEANISPRDRPNDAWQLFSKIDLNATRTSISLLPPGARLAQIGRTIPMTPDFESYVKTHASSWVFVGKVTYQDIFGRRHWSTFCGFSIANGQNQDCPSHNDSDQRRPHE